MNESAEDPLLVRLRRSNPVPPGSLSGRRVSPQASALRDVILGSSAAPRAAGTSEASRSGVAGDVGLVAPARPWWRRPALLVPVGVVLAGGAAAAAAVGTGVAPVHPALPQVVLCYATASLSSPLRVTGSGSGSPEAQCERSWRGGLLGDPVPAHLVTCVQLDGTDAVLPGNGPGVCTALGLPMALAPTRHASAIESLNDVLTQLNGRTCATTAQARSVASGELEHLGLASSWSVRVLAHHAGHTCAVAAIVPGQSLVTIFSLARPAGR